MVRQSLQFTTPHRAEIVEEPLPTPAAGQVLVATMISAISAGTELLFYRGQLPIGVPVDSTIASLSAPLHYPLRYGYACTGRVMACGTAVDTSWQDRLVFAFHPHTSHFLAQPSDLLPLPEGIIPEQAAFLPNMETAVNLVMDGRPVIGERVAVVGAGVVGLLVTALLARFPLADLLVVEPLAARRRLAEQIGAIRTAAPDDFGSLNDAEAADLTFELSGTPAGLDTAIALTGFAGRIVIGSWYGEKRVAIDLGGRFHRSRIQLVSSQVSTLAPMWSGRWDKARRLNVAWEMLKTVETAPLVTHRIPIAEAPSAYMLLDSAPQDAVQILLTYD